MISGLLQGPSVMLCYLAGFRLIDVTARTSLAGMPPSFLTVLILTI
jgi:hypothetical protein